jgi:Protein of unknown function DUF262
MAEEQDIYASEELEPEPPNGLEVELEGESATAEEIGEGIAPPDRRLITQPYDLAVSDLVNQIENGDIILRPVYQRRYVWDNTKASKLVESLLINVPIPVCYLAEEVDGTRATIDGQQRLKSLQRYLDNQFALTGLEVLTELNGQRYFELTSRQQRLIRSRTIRCIVISEDSHPDIRFDVFERLNTGSVALTAQELRNSVYRGRLNDLLHELAASAEFKHVLANRSDTRMNLEELVLRFFALDETLEDYRPSLKRYLNVYMRANRDPEPEALDRRRARFLETVAKVRAVFGSEAFRRARGSVEEWEWLPALNSAVYDVVMLNLARVDVAPTDLHTRANDIQATLVALIFENEDFADAISLATGDRARLFRRTRLFSAALSQLGLSSGLEQLEP